VSDESAGDSLPIPVPVPLVWVGPADETIKTASIFAVQIYAENEIILTVGQVTPPLLRGTPEERAVQAAALPFAQARTLAKFGLTVSRAEKLIDVLQRAIRAHTDRITKGDL
jgi:hypothetical protein